MRALVFDFSIPRYFFVKSLGRVTPGAFWGRFSLLQPREIPDPPLPADDWVRIRVTYGGICGSDLHAIHLESDPRQAGTVFTSFPFVMGHENAGTVVETGRSVRDLSIGQRVMVEPVLPCVTRGFASPCSNCAAGNYNMCLRFTEGRLKPGPMIGLCPSTGGSWGEAFIAHRSQVFPIPAEVSDGNALMAEPFASALYPMLQHRPADGATVLMIGGGVIGQCAIAALRAMGSRARVVALVKYEFQGRMARHLGADLVVRLGRGDRHYEAIADLTGGVLRRPLMGRRVLFGGVDLTVDCVGSSRSVHDALRLTGSKGTVIVLGQASLLRGVDWNPIWLNELYVTGSTFYAYNEWEGRQVRTLELVLRWMAQRKVDLGALVTHRFGLDDYPRALETASGKADSQAFKVVFQPNG